MSDILDAAGRKVVQHKHTITPLQQCFRKVRTNKPRTPGHQKNGHTLTPFLEPDFELRPWPAHPPAPREHSRISEWPGPAKN